MFGVFKQRVQPCGLASVCNRVTSKVVLSALHTAGLVMTLFTISDSPCAANIHLQSE
jgi:hypothetical protein